MTRKITVVVGMADEVKLMEMANRKKITTDEMLRCLMEPAVKAAIEWGWRKHENAGCDAVAAVPAGCSMAGAAGAGDCMGV